MRTGNKRGKVSLESGTASCSAIARLLRGNTFLYMSVIYAILDMLKLSWSYGTLIQINDNNLKIGDL